jgi:hypothetical protein
MTRSVEALPFLSTGALVQRLAPLVPHDLSQPSWDELLRAGQAALVSVAREIAEAKNHDQAAAATLKQNAYLEGMRTIEQQALRTAMRLLVIGPVPGDLAAGCIFTGYLGYGRATVGGALQPIPSAHWEAGTMDWSRRVLTVPSRHDWLGVRVLDLDDVPEQAGALVEAAFPTQDAKVGPSDAQPGGTTGARKRATLTDIDRVLSQHVSSLPNLSKELGQLALLQKARELLPDKDVSRPMFRKWASKKMDPSKRLTRGGRVN